MALRSFVDSAGTEWKVWDVIPSWVREQEEGAGEDQEGPAPPRKSGVDRSLLLTPGLEQGWLCFECDSEKRRLTPIPAGWDQHSDQELEALCEAASARPRIG